MDARSPARRPDRQAFDDHLSWTHSPTPFLSFTDDWYKALGRRRWMLEHGANNVVIIAISSEDLRGIYRAYDIASRLRYTDDSRDQRRRLRNHLDEFLVLGGIRAEEDRILATFCGDGPKRIVSLSIPGLQTMVDMTSDFTPIGTDATHELQIEMYSSIGPKSNDLLVPFILHISKIPPQLFEYREKRVV